MHKCRPAIHFSSRGRLMPPNATHRQWYTIFNTICMAYTHHGRKYTVAYSIIVPGVRESGFSFMCVCIVLYKIQWFGDERRLIHFTFDSTKFKAWQVCLCGMAVQFNSCQILRTWRALFLNGVEESEREWLRNCVIVCAATRRWNSVGFLSYFHAPISCARLKRIRCEQNNNESLKRRSDKYFNTFHNIMRANAKWIPAKWLTNIVNNLWQRILNICSTAFRRWHSLFRTIY